MSEQDQRSKKELTSHISDCKKQFHRFFNGSDGRIFVLKGEFGSGKSHFIRKTILNDEEFKEHFKFHSQISLFGVSRMSGIEERAIGSLKPLNKFPKAKYYEKPFLAIQSALKKKLTGIDLKLSAQSILWWISSNSDFLLVIDDVDRKREALEIEEILGYASSLVEQSEGKTNVVLVVNEDNLRKGEKNQKWDELREKFVDYEFTFKPSPRELAYEYVESDQLIGPIADIHQALEYPNIRSMLKTENHVKNFCYYLSEKGIDFPNEMYEHSAKYASLFLGAGKDYQLSDLNGSVYNPWGIVRKEKTEEDLEREVRHSAVEARKRKIRFEPKPWWDTILHAFLLDGSVEQDLIDEYNKAVPGRQRQKEFSKFQNRVDVMMHGSFRNNDKDLVREIEDGVGKFPDLIDIDGIQRFGKILEGCGQSEEGIWKTWLKARKDKISNHTVQRLSKIVPENCKSELPKIKVADPKSVTPSKFLLKFDDPAVSYDEDSILPALAKWTSTDWRNWILGLSEKEEEHLFPLSAKLRQATLHGISGTPRGDIAIAIQAAMKEIGDTSQFNRWRVEKHFPDVLADDPEN